MWLKILGIACVGVFVGAAIVEARQLRKRSKAAAKSEGEGEGDSDGGDALTADVDAAYEER